MTPAFALAALLATIGQAGDATEPDDVKGAKLLIEIPQSNKVKWSGFQEASDGVFSPVRGNFQVTGGELVSTLGKVEKRAKFTSWSYVYSDASKKKVVGWGPCLSAGELIVSKIQRQEAPRDRFVENSFVAENFDDGHTLIKLDQKKNHRLCILYQTPGRAVAFIGGMAQFEDGEISGIVSDGPANDKFFISTAGFPGTRATINGQVVERTVDTWRNVQP